ALLPLGRGRTEAEAHPVSLSGVRSRFKDEKRTRYFDRTRFGGYSSLRTIRRRGCPRGSTLRPFTSATGSGPRAPLLLPLALVRRLSSSRPVVPQMPEIRPDHVSKDEWLCHRPTSKNGDPLEIPLSSHAISDRPASLSRGAVPPRRADCLAALSRDGRALPPRRRCWVSRTSTVLRRKRWIGGPSRAAS